MKILLHSNSPAAGTGYGVQTAMLARRLAADGHEVAVSCTYGHEIGIGKWTTPEGHVIPLYPRRYSVTGGDILHGHANHFFEGDPRGGWIIPLIDVWALRSPFLADYNVAAWTPVDHIDVPPGVMEFFHHTGAAPIAMSRHGEAALRKVGMEPEYIPLAVDLTVYRPTFTIPVRDTAVSAREMFGLPRNAFVVGMVAMNKGNVLDRKGFSEALFAFGRFHRDHPCSVLFMHTDRAGVDGFALGDMAKAAGIPEHALVFSDQYAYALSIPGVMMAGAYTAMDVLLAPSHGEGFCVPLIEAQACGTPVIASRATAQEELVGAGWLVDGQPMWDQSQGCAAFCPYVDDIVAKLTEAYEADLPAMQSQAIEFAQGYDADRIYDTYWRPFLASLEPGVPMADKPLMDDVAVIVPVMKRPGYVAPLVESFNAHNDGTATLYLVCDPDDAEEIAAVEAAGLVPLISDRGHTFAQKANVGYAQTTESFVFLCGDDCEFTDGWIDAARKLSDRYDVIGTNDSEPGRVRNPDVAAGRHADHWFTRRSYIDDVGSCLEGPGVFAPEAYYHWFTDKEIIALARARGVYGHADDSRVIHHHPGYDGREDLRNADPVYMKAVEWQERDRISFMRRVPLIEGQRVSRGR